jgi:predicted signal transduction protein with EAL and GGDEF domain
MTEAIGKTDRVLILKKPFDTIEVRQLAHALQRRWELARMVTLKMDDLTAMVASQTRELEAANDKLKKEAGAREDALCKLAESHEQIRALAYQDGLTGLPNRRLLNEHLEKVLARARRKNTEFAVLFVDLDNFKLINDTVGHQGADAVLRELAASLNGLIRSEDVLSLYMEQDVDLDTTITLEPITDSVLSRLGGDEFVILLPEIKDRFAAGAVAHRILKRLETPFRAKDNEVFVTASIGIATYPEDGQSADVLIRNADTAMYHAKQQGKAAYQYYSAAMNKASVERLTLESGLRRALEDERLELHYQPQIDVASGRIIGAEALLRWNDPHRGAISPATFIPIAEDCGLILPIGEWVFRRACAQAMAWRRDGLRAIPVAINVSGVQFRRQDLVELVKQVLKESGLEPAMLRIEITETAIMSVRERAVQILRQLRDIGVSVALDDFGTGYSSLSYLKSFPIDMLKIDRSFVAEMLSDETTASITEAIISMTRILGLNVLAEGVETAEQFELLKRLGCDAVQGFYFSPALPAREFGELLASSAGLRAAAGHAGRKAAEG